MDFTNARFIKLSAVEPETLRAGIAGILLNDEELLRAAKGTRDYVVFTSDRIIVVNAQGMLGTKKDITSLPLTRIQAWSIESAGTFDRDSELTLWFSGLGQVRLEFDGTFDLQFVAKLIADHVL